MNLNNEVLDGNRKFILVQLTESCIPEAGYQNICGIPEEFTPDILDDLAENIKPDRTALDLCRNLKLNTPKNNDGKTFSVSLRS